MKITAPDIPTDLQCVDDMRYRLLADEAQNSLHILGANSSHERLKSLVISESRIEKYTLSSTSIERFSVMDCVFIDCELTAAKLPDSSWHSVTLTGVRASGMQVQAARFKNITFKNCKLDLVNFRRSHLENIIFDSCVISEMDFYGAQLKNVTFTDTIIEDVEFSGAKLTHVDFSKTQISSLRGLTSLKGATVSQTQLFTLAPYFASELGLRVVD